VAAKLDQERGRIAAAEAEKAKRLLATDLEDRTRQIVELNEVLKQRDSKLAEAQQAQADLIRKQRELDDAKREIDLTVQKQVLDELAVVREKARQETGAALSLKVREKEEQIASMQRQIEDLRRKAEQGSQQLQGEVQELALEGLLRQKFPRDAFDPVPKGEFGGDLIQHVVGPTGQICGSILWEAKRTKNWSDGWLGKLREDQRAAKADVALIVSQALPKGLQTFDLIDGVWVAEPRCAVAVAIALRELLIALSAARLAGEGQQTKMELVYQYLTGPRFRHRIEAVSARRFSCAGDAVASLFFRKKAPLAAGLSPGRKTSKGTYRCMLAKVDGQNVAKSLVRPTAVIYASSDFVFFVRTISAGKSRSDLLAPSTDELPGPGSVHPRNRGHGDNESTSSAGR
jgi:hypothetical protein